MPWLSRRATPTGDGTGSFDRSKGPNKSKEPEKGPAAPVGYLINRKNALSGEPGIGYNYVLAEDGLYLQSDSSHIQACIPIAPTKVRGLRSIDLVSKGKMHLVHGPIPRGIFTAGIHWFREAPETERFFAVVWRENRYKIEVPQQDGTGSRLTYETPGASVVMEIHSHGIHGAFFSNTDNQDEQAFRIYGVIGKVGSRIPQAKLRIGIYGHFAPLRWEEVFDGTAPPVSFIQDGDHKHE